MARPKKTEPRVRINLDIPAPMRDRLEAIRLATEADSRIEVIRRSVSVYGALIDRIKGGARVYLEADDGALVELLLP